MLGMQWIVMYECSCSNFMCAHSKCLFWNQNSVRAWKMVVSIQFTFSCVPTSVLNFGCNETKNSISFYCQPEFHSIESRKLHLKAIRIFAAHWGLLTEMKTFHKWLQQITRQNIDCENVQNWCAVLLYAVLEEGKRAVKKRCFIDYDPLSAVIVFRWWIQIVNKLNHVHSVERTLYSVVMRENSS